MNFRLFKIKKEPDVDIDSLLEGVKYGSAVGDVKEIRKIINEIRTKRNNGSDFENFERKFQLRYLLRLFHNFQATHKKRSSSIDQNNYSSSLLPNINNNNSSNFDSQNSNSFYGKKLSFMKTNLKNNFERSNSTLFSQNVINNTKSKLILGTIIDFNNTFHKRVSNDAIFDVKKNQYMEAIQKHKIKNKEAKIHFKNELINIKSEKIPECVQNNLFKEFDIKLNPKKLVNCLKKEFGFYHQDNFKKKIDRNNRELLKENYKRNSLYEIKKKDYIKQSQRIIRNIVRKDKSLEINENSNIFMSI